jgi:hypothetical protein
MKPVVLLVLLTLAFPMLGDEPTDDDRRLLVGPTSLHTTMQVDAAAVVCSVGKPNVLTTREVSCEYDSAKGSNAAAGQLFYDTSVSRHPSEKEADIVFEAVVSGYAAGLEKATWTPAQQLIDTGQRHHAAYMMRNGKKIGNAFVIRQGSIVIRLILSGLYYDDPALVHKLLAPLVAEAIRQQR